MNVLIRAAKIVDSHSPLNGTTQDVLIENGSIVSIGSNLEANDATVVEAEDLHISAGWLDVQANFRDPGLEYKEDLQSGLNAAAQGGFTGVVLMPDTEPAVSTKSAVEYLLNKARTHAVEVYPTGSLTKDCAGLEMSEMYDMQQAGAIAFTDSKHTVNNAGLMSRAMLYARNINGLTISFPNDNKLSDHGLMNEGSTSTSLGLTGMPALAETMQVYRDLELAKYNDASLHISSVSTAGSVSLIRAAQADGVKVTAAVNSHHLLLTDDVLVSYDSRFKTMPPLRGTEDVAALKEGLRDGTIAAIASDHSPEDSEHKEVEFSQAAFGFSSIETSFAAARTALEDTMDVESTISKFTTEPRKVLGLPQVTIKEGVPANLTLFLPNATWEMNEKALLSKSKYSAYHGHSLKGKVVGIYNNGQYIAAK